MSAGKNKVLILAGAAVLSVLLFIAPKTVAKGKTEASPGKSAPALEETRASLDVFLSTAEKNLDASKIARYKSLKARGAADSLADFWDKEKRPDLAAWFTEISAKDSKDAQEWMKAGKRYYYAVQFTRDNTEIPQLYLLATRCFRKASELEPKNAEAKIMLASCYVEAGEDPMKGIAMLREIEKTDSNNVQLQLSFGFFSIKSGQLDKAAQRFNKALAADSNYIEAYLHLADVYEQMNDKENTIRVLEKYASKTDDLTARIEIGKYIQQLKNNNN